MFFNFIDELRIRPAFASVVPEPSTAVLMLAGVALVGYRHNGSRRALLRDAAVASCG